VSVYQPKYRDPKTGEMVKAAVWWLDFNICGRRIRESTGVTRKTLAVEAEKRRKLDLERSLAGLPTESKESRIRTVGEVCEAYRNRYAQGHKPKSLTWVNERLAPILRHLAGVVLPDLSEDRIQSYIKARIAEGATRPPGSTKAIGASGRTVNMEISILSRCIGRKRSELWPGLRPLTERRDVGRALTPDEEKRLLEASLRSPSPLIAPFIRIALMTGMRCGEILGLRWRQVDLVDRTITVGQSKTAAGTGRVIPMNSDLYAVMVAFADWHRQECGGTEPDRYVFPSGVKSGVYDSRRKLVNIRKAWEAVRDAAGLKCRIHDLRHHACSRMAEAGVSEYGMMAIMGHVSRAMLERYSHVRLEAKRAAVEALNLSGGKQNEAILESNVKESPKVEAIQ